MGKRFAVVLAAGQGTRMKSGLYKVLHPIAGRPMVLHVLEQLKPLQLEKIATVVGYGAEDVISAIGDKSEFVTQEEQLGTGHAVMQAEDLLGNLDGTTLIVCGDTPLITSETYQALLEHHEETGAKATILTAEAPNPTGYGRIIRNEENQVQRIVEEADTTSEERLVQEINTGTFCFDNRALFHALQNVSNDNAQGEYYITDVIEILKNEGETVEAYLTFDFDETIGINDRVALAEAEKILKRRINEAHMRNGVTIIDPENSYIGPDVEISQDVVIHPGVVITGKTYIKSHVEIGPHSEIENCTIGEHTLITQSVVKDSVIGKRNYIGPYAHIRPGSKIADDVRVGNFVELKKTSLGDHTKVGHLSYVGDTQVGSNVNLGCGTITVNYDGVEKHETVIGDHAFIGCNTNLIAPVEIGDGAFTAAGSTITKNVPEDALSIARSKQVNKEGYALKLTKRKK
ncbi:MAG TPA: bifunctional UDP-N-acetylglucosamine diphosphorylase/glucosamine-1-phosphate N-acetyltransferase GlmU [Bacillota bacterium]|nr:bifunctional UDP-N-acetylglucosamine diphosphorylase/glucosamine-1-phosphate N-acetyltransferase GlmU [Bacillota bacterium]